MAKDHDLEKLAQRPINLHKQIAMGACDEHESMHEMLTEAEGLESKAHQRAERKVPRAKLEH